MNSPGTTIIEGKVVGISKYNQTTFKLRTRDGQEIEYTIPVRIAHMMQLIKRGVYVKIMDTPS